MAITPIRLLSGDPCSMMICLCDGKEQNLKYCDRGVEIQHTYHFHTMIRLKTGSQHIVIIWILDSGLDKC